MTVTIEKACRACENGRLIEVYARKRGALFECNSCHRQVDGQRLNEAEAEALGRDVLYSLGAP